jgi:sulfite exporter TauE/SafE
MISKEHVMSVNVGTLDRIARIVIGLVLIAFALGYIAPGTGWNWVGWIGLVPIVTALFGFCPAYRLFGMSTR